MGRAIRDRIDEDHLPACHPVSRTDGTLETAGMGLAVLITREDWSCAGPASPTPRRLEVMPSAADPLPAARRRSSPRLGPRQQPHDSRTASRHSTAAEYSNRSGSTRPPSDGSDALTSLSALADRAAS